MFKKGVVFLSSLFMFSSLVAQSTSKITGAVTDANTDEILPGVNVFVENTTLGASTDVDGLYSILNVPVGTHTVVFSYVGYKDYKVRNVRLVSGITKVLDAKLEESAVEGEEVVVVAKRPIFERGATNSVRVVDSKELAKLPIRGVTSIAKISANVVSKEGSGTLHFRGSRGDGAQYIVDGIKSGITLPEAAISQVSTEIGAFNAKYGDINGGIVHVTTKGPSKVAKFDIEAVSSFLDPFNERRLSLTGTGPLNSSLGYFVTAEYFAVNDRTPQAIPLLMPKTGEKLDVRPNNGMDRINVFSRLDWVANDNLMVSLSLDGYFSDQRRFENRGVDRSDVDYRYNPEHSMKQLYWEHGARIKTTYTFSKKSFLTFAGNYRLKAYIRGDAVHFNRWVDYGLKSKNPNFVTNGVNLESTHPNELDYSFFAAPGQVNDIFRKYKSETFNLNLDFSQQTGIHFLEIGASLERFTKRWYGIEPVKLQLKSSQKKIKDGLGINVYDNLAFGTGYDLYGNEIDDYQYYNLLNPDKSVAETNRKNPPIGQVQTGFYMNDRVEFNDFILNVGFRIDIYNTVHVQRIKNLGQFFGKNNILDKTDFEDYEAVVNFSPRIGLAFPVSDEASFHAAYGVLRQNPDIDNVYTSWGSMKTLENRFAFRMNTGHIGPSRTDVIELGYKHNFSDKFGFEVTAHHKNQVGLENLTVAKTRQRGKSGSIYTRSDVNFSIVKGVSFTFKAFNLGPVSTTLDYTYQSAEASGSDDGDAFIALFRDPQNFTTLNFLMPVDFDRKHVMSLVFDYRYGENDAPINFLKNMGLNVLYRYASGFRYTPLKEMDLQHGSSNFGTTAQALNSASMPPIERIDLRLTKDFEISNVDMQVYLRIENLLNVDNVVDVYQSSGDPGDTYFTRSENGKKLLARKDKQYFKDRKAWEYHEDNYGTPRRILVGLKVNF